MNPRAFLNFFHTRAGKLTLFAGLLTTGLVIYQHTRTQSASSAAPTSEVNRKDRKASKPQVIETIRRKMEIFEPPTPKPEQKNQSTAEAGYRSVESVATGGRREHGEQAEPVEPIEPGQHIGVKAADPVSPILPISLFAETPSQPSAARTLSDNFAPYGRLISCETVVTVDSSSIRTPIIGLVTEDVYYAGRLIIPAGTEVHGTAASDRTRERLASGTAWTLVWQTGEELRLNAIALDREFESDTNHVGWGITDGSAGLRGQLIKSDNLAEIKLFAATFLSGAASAMTEKEQTIFGSVDSQSLNNAPFQGAQKVLSEYAQSIYDAIQRDGFYVRVPSGKQFYLYVLQTIDRTDARLGASGESSSETNEPGLTATVQIKPQTHKSSLAQPFTSVQP